MNKLKTYLVLLLFAPVLGCTEKVDLELDDIESSLVIEAALSNTPGYQFIRITRSGSYFDDERAELVSGAVISITDGSNTFDYRESSPGRYYTIDEVAGVPGTSYFLRSKWTGRHIRRFPPCPGYR